MLGRNQAFTLQITSDPDEYMHTHSHTKRRAQSHTQTQGNTENEQMYKEHMLMHTCTDGHTQTHVALNNKQKHYMLVLLAVQICAIFHKLTPGSFGRFWIDPIPHQSVSVCEVSLEAGSCPSDIPTIIKPQVLHKKNLFHYTSQVHTGIISTG